MPAGARRDRRCDRSIPPASQSVVNTKAAPITYMCLYRAGRAAEAPRSGVVEELATQCLGRATDYPAARRLQRRRYRRSWDGYGAGRNYERVQMVIKIVKLLLFALLVVLWQGLGSPLPSSDKKTRLTNWS